MFDKNCLELDVVVHVPLIPTYGRQRQVDFYDVRDFLVYSGSSKPAGDTISKHKAAWKHMVNPGMQGCH